MSKIINAKIDVTKITKDKIFDGKKGKYLDINIAVNDQANEYGQNVSIWESQTQEERTDEQPRNYLGNGKVVWDSSGQGVSGGNKKSKEKGKKSDDIPF